VFTFVCFHSEVSTAADILRVWAVEEINNNNNNGSLPKDFENLDLKIVVHYFMNNNIIIIITSNPVTLSWS